MHKWHELWNVRKGCANPNANCIRWLSLTQYVGRCIIHHWYKSLLVCCKLLTVKPEPFFADEWDILLLLSLNKDVGITIQSLILWQLMYSLSQGMKGSERFSCTKLVLFFPSHVAIHRETRLIDKSMAISSQCRYHLRSCLPLVSLNVHSAFTMVSMHSSWSFPAYSIPLVWLDGWPSCIYV